MVRANAYKQVRASLAIVALCTLAALLVSCAADGNGGGGSGSAEVVDRWQAAPEPGRQYATVFVIGIAEKDEVRRQFEDEFVRQLQGQGVRGIASYTVMPQTSVPREQVVQAVRDSGADGVLVTRLVNREQRHKASFGPDGYYAHYSVASQQVVSPRPPVVYRTEVVTLETRLFDAANEKMVWVASTELFDPRTTQSQIARLVRALVKDLQKGKLI